MKSHSFVALWMVAIALSTQAAQGLDYVTVRQQDKEARVAGRVLVSAQDGGLLVLAQDGVIWMVQPDEIVARTSDDLPFHPLSADEMSQRILGELPHGFEVRRTSHYLIFYNTSRDYAAWCGSLFERLYLGFTNFWTRRGFALKTPDWPLVAVIFADQRSYQEYARAELRDSVGAVIGYFSLKTNRMTMFDLTGTAGAGRVGRGGSAAQINRILAQPDAERTVATVVHEATHQIAYNCGLHTRFSDCPLWFSEGIAVYFETPDLSSAKGWKSIGAINPARLSRFQEYAQRRPTDSLESLVGNDRRLRDPQQGLDAYAEAWALTYFLLNQRPKQYMAYLQMLSAKPPMQWDDPQTRLREFRQAFGDDLKKLDTDFTRYMLRLR